MELTEEEKSVILARREEIALNKRREDAAAKLLQYESALEDWLRARNIALELTYHSYEDVSLCLRDKETGVEITMGTELN